MGILFEIKAKNRFNQPLIIMLFPLMTACYPCSATLSEVIHKKLGVFATSGIFAAI